MIRKNAEKSIGTLWLQGHLKRGLGVGGEGGEEGGEAESKGGTVSFYDDNEAKEADVKEEYPSNGRKSMSKPREAGALRQGGACTSPQAQQGSSEEQQLGHTLIMELNMC